MTAAQPKNAATVILLRPGENGGFEVFMTRRLERMNFLGGVYVFPGGVVRMEDRAEGILRRSAGLSGERAKQILGAHLSPDLALAHWLGAVRELFEEVGVLLCVEEAGEAFDPRSEERKKKLAEMRQRLIDGSITFQSLLQAENLFCDASRLAYFSHWLTPEEFPDRYDTRFFLAPLPKGQSPLESSSEVAHGLWLTPERALRLSESGELPVIFPTFASLRTLADFDSPERLLAEYQGWKKS
jgi:8-oxo-dGTP pyrophosphatase MutT (NUDIX family)